MLGIFRSLRHDSLFHNRTFYIDHVGCRLHYRITFTLLLVCTILVSHQQYIGENIKCHSGKKFDGVAHFMNTYCYTTTTYTQVPHIPFNQKYDLYPGISARLVDQPETYHAYYLWVPYVLFLQAMFFYVPHMIWKMLEGGKVQSFSDCLTALKLPSGDSNIAITGDHVIPSRDERRLCILRVRQALSDRFSMDKVWAGGLVFSELLNALNVGLQMYLMNKFLGGHFFELGKILFNDDSGQLDVVFPKMTKCKIPPFGPSGSIQIVDTICVMAVNVINKKIYIFLFVWFSIVSVITAGTLLYRVTSLVLYSRSLAFNKYVFRLSSNAQLDTAALRSVQQSCDYSDWLFLQYLASCIDRHVFKELFEQLADDLENKKPRIIRGGHGAFENTSFKT